MKDRIPTKPNRVLITPEDGGAPFYATLTRADDPTEDGSALNKANILKDETAIMYGLDDNAVPNDIFALMANTPRYKKLTEIDVQDGEIAELDVSDPAFQGKRIILKAIPEVEGSTFEFLIVAARSRSVIVAKLFDTGVQTQTANVSQFFQLDNPAANFVALKIRYTEDGGNPTNSSYLIQASTILDYKSVQIMTGSFRVNELTAGDGQVRLRFSKIPSYVAGKIIIFEELD